MESETKFIPQWLQARQQNNSTPNGSSRGGDRFFMGSGAGITRDKDIGRSSSGKSNHTVKYQLAEHRYGREEMLALFDPSNMAPDDLKSHPIFVQESLNPISFMPMLEEEEVLSLHNVNSYGYKPYVRGGMARGGLRGDFGGRGRGRGRDDDGRLRSRDSWDDRSKTHDYSGQGYNEDAHATPHRTDFFSPNSHHSTPYNRSNSNDSWRSRSHQQDSDDYRRDRWGLKSWRETKIEGRLHEEPFTVKGIPSRERHPADFKRSKSLFEEEEISHKSTEVPEWSTVDKEDLGMEGSFDSSGAFMASKQKGVDENESSGSTTRKSESIDEALSHSVDSKKSAEEEQGDDKISSSSDSISNHADPDGENAESATSKNQTPVPESKVGESEPDASKSELKQGDSPGMVPVPVEVTLCPTPFFSDQILPSQLQRQQPFSYERNAWYYVDPQGATQGPFRDADMAEWYYQGYFDTTLMLKAGVVGEFMTLGAFSSKVGSLPFVSQRPPTSIPSTHDLPRIPLNILPSVVDPVSPEVLQPDVFYPRPTLVPHSQSQLQPVESLSSSFLSPLPLVSGSTSSGLFPPATVHMPLLNGDIPGKTAWNHPVQMYQDKGMDEVAFNTRVSHDPGSLWNTSLLPPNSISISGVPNQMISNKLIADHIKKPFLAQNLDYASVAQRSKPMGEHAAPHKPENVDLEARKKLIEQEQLFKEMRIEELNRHQEAKQAEMLKMQEEQARMEELKRQEEMRKRLEEEEIRIQQELLEKLRIKEEAQQREALDQGFRLQQEELGRIGEVSAPREDEFKPVEESRKSKEMKKRKEAKRQEEAKKQEEARRAEEAYRQEVQRKLEEQRRAGEAKKKEEEEKIRKFMEAAEEAKRREMEELNQRKLLATKSAWASGQSASLKTGFQKITEIQSIERAQSSQQHHAEKKMAVPQQKQTESVAKSSGKIWKAPVITTPAPKSLLDIQMEQASQLETPAKVKPQGPAKTPPKAQPKVQAQTQVRVPEVSKVQESVKDCQPWETVSATSSKKQQKSLVNQFPALAPAKSTSAKKPATKTGRPTKDEIAVQKIFEAVKVKDELTEWCEKALAGVKTEVDIPTLVDLLKALDNSSEVINYIHCYLGDSKQVREFAKQFVERNGSLSQEHNAWSVVGRQGNNGSSKSLEKNGTDKSNKKGKKKQQKVDANFLLGFTVHADPDRTNVGEIDTTPPVGSRK